jgi:hypothetical protein
MVLNGVARSTYFGVLGLTSGSPSHEPKSFPGRVVVGGFSFFLVVIFSSYTAGSKYTSNPPLAYCEILDLC